MGKRKRFKRDMRSILRMLRKEWPDGAQEIIQVAVNMCRTVEENTYQQRRRKDAKRATGHLPWRQRA